MPKSQKSVWLGQGPFRPFSPFYRFCRFHSGNPPFPFPFSSPVSEIVSRNLEYNTYSSKQSHLAMSRLATGKFAGARLTQQDRLRLCKISASGVEQAGWINANHTSAGHSSCPGTRSRVVPDLTWPSFRLSAQRPLGPCPLQCRNQQAMGYSQPPYTRSHPAGRTH